MRSIAILAALTSLSSLSFAADVQPQLILDKINFQIASKEWVTTQTALLTVNINVSLNNADLVKARAEVMNSLNKVAKGEWHLVQFDRSQDSSGLEKLYVQAQARINQADLTDIYKQAKSVSMPGAQYDIGSVEFKPSLEETQTVRAAIREKLYQQVNEEIARMNKAYPLQSYSVSNLVFVEGDNPPVQPRAYEAKTMNAMALAASAPSLAVSNELVITALVEAASNRKEGN